MSHVRGQRRALTHGVLPLPIDFVKEQLKLGGILPRTRRNAAACVKHPPLGAGTRTVPCQYGSSCLGPWWGAL